MGPLRLSIYLYSITLVLERTYMAFSTEVLLYVNIRDVVRQTTN